MNGNQRKKLHYRLIGRDGPNCKRCDVSNTVLQLVIDHIDNNNRNNLLDNLQLLCRACNYRKNPRISERDSSDVSNENKQTGSSSIIINKEKEQNFRDFVYEIIIFGERRNHSKKKIVDSGAEVVDISTETAKRYFKKLSSLAGLLESNGLYYTLKDTWWCKYPKRDEDIIQNCILNLKNIAEIKKKEETEEKEKELKEESKEEDITKPEDKKGLDDCI
jgi:hypothetical protein